MSGGFVKRLAIIMQNKDTKNAGNIPGTTNSGGIDAAMPNLSHIITVTVPEIIPAIAPHLVVRFHQSDRIIRGPKDAANPPHANATKK